MQGTQGREEIIALARANLSDAARKHFRDELRAARADVLRDAEAFDSVLFVIERLGQVVAGRQEALGRYRRLLADVLFDDTRRSEFARIALIVNEGRNHALHQGAAARHLAQNCVSLAIMIEDSLSEGFMQVSDFMVANPVCADLWQPLSLLRQAMLAGSFSYLPYLDGYKAPRLVSDHALVRYLRGDSVTLNKERLAESLSTAVEAGLTTISPVVLAGSDSIAAALSRMHDDVPAVVVGPNGAVTGIVTAFDLL
jgi:CBS domain-containing protein